MNARLRKKAKNDFFILKYFFTLMNNAASGKGHGKYGKT